MQQCQHHNNITSKNQKQILKETEKFNKKLYTKRSMSNETYIEKQLANCNFNILSDKESELLEGEITYSELLTFLKDMKNDKSPGSDGFTAEFLNSFGKT